MADQSTLIVDALRRAAAEPSGLPLFGGKTAPGLFPTSALARQAAQHCRDEAYLRVVRTEARGKTSLEICTLTDKGMAHLVEQVSPRRVLEDLARALDARGEHLATLTTAVQQGQSELQAFRGNIEKVLQSLSSNGDLTNAFVTWKKQADADGAHQGALGAVLTLLQHRHAAGTTEDCPLPELYRHACGVAPSSIGQFHDILRRLVDENRIYLHPWTGPLSEMPEPACALLVGHEVAYYASLRK
jgi:hypothetical protein